MRPEDFAIKFEHWDDGDGRCDWNLTILCPANDWECVVGGPDIPNDKLGEALEAARRHIAEVHTEQNR